MIKTINNKTLYRILAFLVMLTLFFIGIKKQIKAENNVESKNDKVVKIEINRKLNFNDIIYEVLKDDVKYVAHPQKLDRDVKLAEIVTSEIDYSSFDVQEVDVEVLRFADSKADKHNIDSITSSIKIEFYDKTKPEIFLKKEKVSIFEKEKLNLEDYLGEVSDNSFDEVAVNIEDDIDYNKAGKYQAKFIAKDSSNNTSEAVLEVNVKEKPKPKPKVIKPTQKASENNQIQVVTDSSANNDVINFKKATRYGFDCYGCRIYEGGYSKSAGGIKFGDNIVQQSNGAWQEGLTYDGYYIVATSSNLPLHSIIKINKHPFSGSGITANQPFYAIVGDRGVGHGVLDLFIGSEKNINRISQRGNPRNANIQAEVIRYGR